MRNIIDSYNHDWDLIAELAQNAVDAIRIRQPSKGHMALTVDAPNRRIQFEDNGCGIDPTKLPNLLAPFSSDKIDNTALIGQKGVGVSFVIFSSATFRIETRHENGASEATIDGAWAWIDSKTDNLPKLSINPRQESRDFGTTVSITLPDVTDYEFFELSLNQLEMVLRSRTAIGDTETIWGGEATSSTVITFTDLNGEKHVKEVEGRYFLPTERLASKQYISLRDFQEWNTGEKTDAQKRRRLYNKLVYLDGTRQGGGRRIRFWACFVPSRKSWDTLSVSASLIEKEILDLNPVVRQQDYGDAEYLFSGGMYTSTRGMPTGIRSDIPPKGSAGYLPNFFIVLDDPQLRFDIGRKSIPGRQLGMLREIASNVFRDFVNGIKKYIGGEPDVQDAWDRTATFNEIRDLPILASPNTLFSRRPSGQEATVVALFFELLGRGRLPGFVPYLSGYKSKYDLYSKFRSSDVVVEFKYALSALFRDFDDEAKLFDEIDIVVVWEITEADHEVVKTRGLNLDEVEAGLDPGDEAIFHFDLSLWSTKPIRIVCLKELVL
ncbi:MAG: ATP-binding protein [Gammaproteobacteria bacterium]|nr:ATP-binding protein [Gammaproteobacteria bacterium]